MNHHFGWLACLLVLLAMPMAASTSRIYVLNRRGDTVEVIDPATNKIVQTIAGIASPNGAAFSPDKRTAYITSETEDALYKVDLQSGKTDKKVALSPGSADLPAITKDGNRIFVCINGVRDEKGNMLSDRGGFVDVVDATTFQKVKSISLKGGMHDCYITPDGKYVVAGSLGGRFFAVIDPESGQILWDMHFDNGVLNLAFEAGPDGSTQRVFVLLTRFRGFAVVDFATHKEITRVSFPDQPSGFMRADDFARKNNQPTHGSVVAPDGKTLWIASRGSNAVFAYSLPELKLLGFVSSPILEGAQHPADGADPGWLTFTPDGRTVYVANAADNSVTAIDAKTIKIVARIPVGRQPDHVDTLVLP